MEQIQTSYMHREVVQVYLVDSLVLPADDVCSPNVSSSGELDTLLGDGDDNCNNRAAGEIGRAHV